MAPLSALVRSPALSALLAYVSRPRSDPDVEEVALVEDLGDVAGVAEHSVVLLTRAASAQAGGYRFDMALRLARDRRVAALVLPASAVERITPTAATIANRSGTAILGTIGDVELAGLAVTIARELAGASAVALLRAHAAVRAIEAHPAGGSTEALLQHAGAALGIPLVLTEAKPNGPAAAVVVAGQREGWLTAPPQEGDMAMSVDIVLSAAAAATAEALARDRRDADLPIQSGEEVITQLLSSAPQTRMGLVVRARNLGLPIDGWHIVARLEAARLADAPPEREVDGYQARLALARTALQAVRAGGGEWHSARGEEAVVLVRMSPEDPGFNAAADVAAELDGALARVRTRLPAMLIRCGVGTAHPGVTGLLSSAGEAKAAMTAARASGRVNTAVPFDTSGLRRTLVEWYASDTAREAVTSVLAPLTELGGARAERLIQTLHVYLDQRCSLSKTAATLNLHRNAVAYRINQVFELLDVDRDKPDDLLLLQLACRARELA